MTYILKPRIETPSDYDMGWQDYLAGYQPIEVPTEGETPEYKAYLRGYTDSKLHAFQYP